MEEILLLRRPTLISVGGLREIDSVAALPHPVGAHFVRPNRRGRIVELWFKSLDIGAIGQYVGPDGRQLANLTLA